MRDHAIVSPQFWKDHQGNKYKTPTIVGRLKFRIPLHAKLRSFVFRRDGFVCKLCGERAVDVPHNYNGRNTVATESGGHLVLDHIVSRRNNGSHHPTNLQTLCEPCNARKSGLIDSKFEKLTEVDR